VDTVDPTTRAKHARHEAAEHLGSVGKSGPWLVPTLIIGVVLLAVAAAGWWFTRSSAATAAESAIASSSAHALATSTGQLGQITLDDGTTARLGADSRIRVPAGFGEKLRAIGLEGAAMFTVAPGQPFTFDVRTRDAWIKATGTVFAVRAYPNEEAVTVRVKEGTVTVQRGDETRTLAAGSALSITKDGTITEPSAAALDEALAWTDGFMSLHQRPLRHALAEVSRWYGLTMFVRDSSLLTRTVTMRAPLESNREMIAALEKGGGLVFGYEGKNMTLSDTLPTPPAKGASKK
jgi:ferric-dicitrate binding protein FerR (iron transport regulator)